MLAQFIANDDQFQVSQWSCVSEFILQHCKRFDEPMKILVRSDSAGIQDERILQLIPFEDLSRILCCSRQRKPIVQRIVNDADFRWRQIEDIDQVVLGGVGNRDHLVGSMHDSLRMQVTPVIAKF